MVHPDEENLEAFVMERSQMSETVRSEIESHLEGCSACREWVEYIRSFYDDLERTPPEEPSGLTDLVDSLFPVPAIIELRPFRRKPDEPLKTSQQMTVLAAATETETKARYWRLAVLASETEEVVARFIYDSVDDHVDVYLVTKDEKKRSHTIVSIPSLGVECVTNEQGHGRFKAAGTEKMESSSQYVILRIPVFETSVSLTDKTVGTFEHDGVCNVVGFFDGHLFHLEVEPSGKARSTVLRATLQDEADQIHLLILEEGKGSYRFSRPPSALTLRLYH